MKKILLPCSLLVCAISAALAGCQETAFKPDSASMAEPMMQQPALDQLKRMSTALAAAKAISLRSSSTVEVPAKTGQFVTLFATSEITLQRPDKLRVNVTGEVPNYEFYYDGKTIVASATGDKVYSITPAPTTIDAMMPFADEKTGIHFATADVLFSDPYAMLTQGVTSAFVVGKDTIQGTPCEHLAFRSPGVNWEIWIESGPSALPRRLAVTYTTVTNFPRFLVEMSDWNLQPSLAAGNFDFKKPADAKEITFQPIDFAKAAK